MCQFICLLCIFQFLNWLKLNLEDMFSMVTRKVFKVGGDWWVLGWTAPTLKLYLFFL